MKATAVAGSETDGGIIIPPNQDYCSFQSASKVFAGLKVTSFEKSTSEDFNVGLPPFTYSKNKKRQIQRLLKLSSLPTRVNKTQIQSVSVLTVRDSQNR